MTGAVRLIRGNLQWIAVYSAQDKSVFFVSSRRL